jgi:hypothetical protein
MTEQDDGPRDGGGLEDTVQIGRDLGGCPAR